MPSSNVVPGATSAASPPDDAPDDAAAETGSERAVGARRRRLPVLVAAVAVVAALAASILGATRQADHRGPGPGAGTAPPAGDRPDGPARFEDTLGFFASGSPRRGPLDRREEWLGADITHVQVSVRRQASWAEWRTDVGENLDGWLAEPETVAMSLPMAVEQPVDAADTLDVAAGAAGRYDEHWAWLGQRLLETAEALDARGERLVDRFVLRPGWEHNGPWFRHSSNPAANPTQGREFDPSRPDDFATYWRRLHDLVMAPLHEAGHDVRWEWNVARAGEVADVEAAFPTGTSPVTGDAYADVVALDVYDTGAYPPVDAATRAETWRMILEDEPGLRWLEGFADRHTGGRLALGEWGVTENDRRDNGGLDNPEFIENMHAWLVEQFEAGRLQWHRYFDADAPDGNHRLSPGGVYDFSESAATFRRLFGG